MRKMKLFFTALAVMMTSVAFAQNITVTGIVKDSSTGEFVPFASISVKGTMTGASTDADGQYSMTVPADGVLVFTSLGYHSAEIFVDGKTVIDVELDPDKEVLESAQAELIIPMNPNCESLNAAIAAAIVMWQMKV